MNVKIATVLTAAIVCTAVAGEPLLTPERYAAECRADLESAAAIFHGLENLQDEKTIETVLKPLNELDILIGNTAGKASLFYNVHPDAAIRDIAEKHEQAITKLVSEISLSRPVYEACLAVDASSADADTQRALEHVLRDYRRSGVNQPDEVRERIKKLNDELTELDQAFSVNVRSDVRSIKLDSPAELDGMPDDYIAAHPPGEDGKITITTDYPDYVPFSRFARNDGKRLELYKEFKNRGYPKNEQILKDILIKRHELANLLGYNNYADYVTETKMVKTPKTIHSFIDDVALIAKVRAEKEYNLLLERLKQIDPDAETVGDWQKTYLEELIRQEQFNVDAKEIRTYFQFGHVRDGVLKLTGELFGVQFRPWETEVWAPDVQAFEVLDGDTAIGRFYLDLHPRENKYKHAAHFGILSGVNGRQLPTAALVCNFPGKDDETELMEHSDVETFLHEFGHLLHSIFAGNQEWARFSGIATELDFIEAPSQMLEEWVWNPQSLSYLALSKEGKPIPADLVAKMVAAKEFGSGLFATHQMFYAATSINFYDCDPAALDLSTTMDQMQRNYSLFAPVSDTHMYANFGHLVGYSAMYISYMWSLVISKDLFSRFEEAGLFDPAVAQKYRRCILAPGGSKDAADLVEDFLGRPYSIEPFEQWLNTPIETGNAATKAIK
ncbi:MAG: Zn-dependent oligopeptidase [Pontiellaceae bacterium]|nr:Zn-dependent oligopeptidase [Pontiellaceae bacterium]